MSLVDEIHRGADIAIGSRYQVENGFGEFNLIRKTMSKGANLLAKILLRKLPDIKDIRSGFFALKRDVIKDVELKPAGYQILLEILAVGKYKTVTETGYTFSKREKGKSKLGAGTIIDYIRYLISLSWREGELLRFLKYCIIGATGIVINTATLFFFTGILGMFYLLSSAAAYEVSIITNFIMNDRWTFKELVIPGISNSFLTRAVYYNGTMVLGAVFGIVLLLLLSSPTRKIPGGLGDWSRRFRIRGGHRRPRSGFVRRGPGGAGGGCSSRSRFLARARASPRSRSSGGRRPRT